MLRLKLLITCSICGLSTALRPRASYVSEQAPRVRKVPAMAESNVGRVCEGRQPTMTGAIWPTVVGF